MPAGFHSQQPRHDRIIAFPDLGVFGDLLAYSQQHAVIFIGLLFRPFIDGEFQISPRSLMALGVSRYSAMLPSLSLQVFKILVRIEILDDPTIETGLDGIPQSQRLAFFILKKSQPRSDDLTHVLVSARCDLVPHELFEIGPEGYGCILVHHAGIFSNVPIFGINAKTVKLALHLSSKLYHP
jgi:hypothetical protein